MDWESSWAKHATALLLILSMTLRAWWVVLSASGAGLLGPGGAMGCGSSLARMRRATMPAGASGSR